MMKKKMKMLIMGGMLALMAMPVKAQKWEGLADTPQMGWSTWNKFQGNISEDVIRGIADVMAEVTPPTSIRNAPSRHAGGWQRHDRKRRPRPLHHVVHDGQSADSG